MSAALDRGYGAMGDDPGYPNTEYASMDAGDEPVSTTAGVARHQGSELPRTSKCDLPTIVELSSEETDLSDWISMLRNCLKPMMLKDLIDDKIPRPGKDDPLYRRWVFWSTSVAAWMNL